MLDTLDRLAQTETSAPRFYAELLGQLKLALAAKDCCIIANILPSRWSSLAATSALFGGQAIQQLTSFITQHATAPPLRWVDEVQDSIWIGCGLQGSNWSAGGVVVQLPLLSAASGATLSRPANLTAMYELLEAFAEIANRYQLKHGFARVDPKSHEVRSVAESILACQTAKEADKVLVDGARCLLDADRVTLVSLGSNKRNSKTLAISGHPVVDQHSNFVRSLQKHLHSTNSGRDPSDELANWATEIGSDVAIPYPISNAKAATSNVLVLEWFDKDRFVLNASRIDSTLPWLAIAWKTFSRSKSAGNLIIRFLKYAFVAACLIGCAAYFTSSTELTIHSQGTLQPSVQRFVFSPTEGYVKTIHVADGQSVRSGEIIATMESPQLQLQINQVASEIGIVDQKRNSLNLTLNQLKPADDQSNLAASRLAGEIQELEARRQNLLEQKTVLDREQQRLQLRSPIDGTVIAWEVERHLENRPVRRGDMLFRIASLQGQWQIESTVVDWESGYVAKAQRAQTSEKKSLAIEFVLASATNDRGVGRINHFGNTMRDVNGNQHLDLVIALNKPIENPRLGTSATVSIPCGQFPRWFVWTKSILDAVRRRFWL